MSKSHGVLIVRLGAILGAVVSLGWFFSFVAEIIESYRQASTWDGVECCDPLDDITFVFVLCLFPLIVLAFTVLAAQNASPTATAMVSSMYLGLGTIGLGFGPEDHFFSGGWRLAFESVSAEISIGAGLVLLAGVVIRAVGARR